MLQDRLERFARRGKVDARAAMEQLQEAFIDVDARLRKELPEEDRSGTTVVAAVITRPRPSEYCVQLAHCGDSRAVLCTGRKLVCTEDHKPQREDETQRIRAAGGTVEQGPLGGGPLRVDGQLAVSRALGDFHFKPEGTEPAECKVTAMPEVQTVTPCAAGDWLLLACDGVFDVMENEEVHEFISSRLSSAAADGGKIMADLLQLCLEKGSKDNCTACLVQLAPSEPKPLSRELLQGPWEKAPAEVQAKYAEFFAAHGFEAEAMAVHSTKDEAAAPSQAEASEPAAADELAPPGQSRIVAFAKALQAMRSSRVIQGARGGAGEKDGGSGANGSAAGSAKGGGGEGGR